MNSLSSMTNIYYNPVNPVMFQLQQNEPKRQQEMKPTEVFEKLLYKECEKNSRIIGTPPRPVQASFNQFAFQRAGRTLALVNQGERQTFSVRDGEGAASSSNAELLCDRKAPQADLASCPGVDGGPQYPDPQPALPSGGRVESAQSVRGF